jgi:ornithine lipid ester-linked acyl 2-hydroxylase
LRSVAEPQGRREHNRQQKSATIGTRPMERPTLVTRFFMRIVGWVEHLNLALSAVGNPTIYDKAIFPWAYLIESEWQTIRAELQRVLARKEDLPAFHELAADASAISNDHRWKSFVLTGYGFSSANNIRLCPETWRICQSIPGLITVLFSILEPGKHLPAHRGPYNGVPRLHLGLIVPEPRERLGIRVDSQIYRWREGEVVIFDDAYEHEAWNDTSDTRVSYSSISENRCVFLLI